ncbi:MAG: hypothetical protein IKO45_02365 [Clostridia bacterium]|nr:hypothetical protein [Clostridia bacterium]
MDDVVVKLAQHDEQIKTLFTSVNDLKKLTETVSDLGKSTMLLAESVKTLRSDVDDIKETRKFKTRQIWTTVVTGVVSALVGYLMAVILG